MGCSSPRTTLHRTGPAGTVLPGATVDAIHLASGLTIAMGPVVMATWEGRLDRAAEDVGLATLPGQMQRRQPRDQSQSRAPVTAVR